VGLSSLIPISNLVRFDPAGDGLFVSYETNVKYNLAVYEFDHYGIRMDRVECSVERKVLDKGGWDIKVGGGGYMLKLGDVREFGWLVTATWYKYLGVGYVGVGLHYPSIYMRLSVGCQL